MLAMEIDGEFYTEEQYKKDYVRMFEYIRNTNFEVKGCTTFESNKCPLFINIDSKDSIGFSYVDVDTVRIVHKWAKEHPVMTNREKLREVFNVNLDKDTELYLSYYAGQRIKFDLTAEDRWINQPINKWLDSEYKGTKKNDSSNY